MKVYDPLAAYNTIPIEQPSLVKRFLAFLLDFSLLSITVFTPLSAVLEKLAPSTNFSATYAALTSNEATSAVITIIMVFVFTLDAVFRFIRISAWTDSRNDFYEIKSRRK